MVRQRPAKPRTAVQFRSPPRDSREPDGSAAGLAENRTRLLAVEDGAAPGTLKAEVVSGTAVQTVVPGATQEAIALL